MSLPKFTSVTLVSTPPLSVFSKLLDDHTSSVEIIQAKHMNCSVLTFYKKEFIIFSVEVDFFLSSKIHTWGKSEAIYECSLKVLDLTAQRLLGIIFPDLVSLPPPIPLTPFSLPLFLSLE